MLRCCRCHVARCRATRRAALSWRAAAGHDSAAAQHVHRGRGGGGCDGDTPTAASVACRWISTAALCAMASATARCTSVAQRRAATGDGVAATWVSAGRAGGGDVAIHDAIAARLADAVAGVSVAASVRDDVVYAGGVQMSVAAVVAVVAAAGAMVTHPPPPTWLAGGSARRRCVPWRPPRRGAHR